MIKSASFVKSMTSVAHLPDDDFAQILLLGRSNVGKSSFINAICNRKSLARVSNTPGKTITLNLYLLNDNLYLVDAPGYGYARRSHTDRDEFVLMIENFILRSKNLRRIFLLVDFKVGPTKDDIETYNALLKTGKPITIICTKYDKVKSSYRLKQQNEIKKIFIDNESIYFVSNETKYGIDKVIDYIVKIGEADENK